VPQVDSPMKTESFQEATSSYERWRAARIPILAEDLAVKHEKLKQSPFVLLRGTYYRFLSQFELLLPELARAPAVVAVGDLHVENFGTWRDRDARLAWGVNDFDEIDLLPYTLDLVRLASSASLAISAGHLRLAPEDACDAISSGWRERIGARRGEPFVFFGRFIPLLRSFVSFAAGLGEMPIAKFLVFTVVGCAMWCAALTSVGYELGSSYRHVLKDFSDAGYVLGALFVVAVVILFVHRIRVVRAERPEHAS